MLITIQEHTLYYTDTHTHKMKTIKCITDVSERSKRENEATRLHFGAKAIKAS